MVYMCMSCLREYYKEALNSNNREGYNYMCPSVECGDIAVVEIDDIIAPVIKILNEKGYYTDFCCSGHYYEGDSTNTYISFYEDCVPDIIPKGFILEDRGYYKENGWKSYNGKVCLRKFHKNKNTRAKDILKTSLDLLEWVNKLGYKNT